jgi:hypothetical protein
MMTHAVFHCPRDAGINENCGQENYPEHNQKPRVHGFRYSKTNFMFQLAFPKFHNNIFELGEDLLKRSRSEENAVVFLVRSTGLLLPLTPALTGRALSRVRVEHAVRARYRSKIIHWSSKHALCRS